MAEFLFYLGAFLVLYTYLGYGLLVWVILKLRGWRYGLKPGSDQFTPDVTLIVPAYNERSCLADKVENSLAQHYPRERIKFLFVTEGSTDGSDAFLQANYAEQVDVLGGTERRGKVAAMNRAMQLVKTPIAIFTDANTHLNPEAVQRIAQHFYDPKVGAVAGEKRILVEETDTAAGSGEGLYWKYESFLKKQDAELQTIVGAAGELFAVRTELYEHTEPDTILDDFIISLRIAGQGYRVAYEPGAYALERPSFSIIDEQKRKIRIAAGGFQSISRLKYLMNPFRNGWLAFEYVSHRVMRWAVAPLCLPVILLANVWLALSGSPFWLAMLAGQAVFYGAAWMGYQYEKRGIRQKLLFVPFYFTFMNVCVLAGLRRYWRGAQSGAWEKVRRAGDVPVNAP